ncbi:MAG: 4Fe-4S binding protein [bacterium]|nr:4Fe-4S binding protein [bacterium]
MKPRTLRYTFLSILLAIVTYTAIWGKRSFEAWCPFGGMESLWGLFTVGQFSCVTGPLNLSMLVAIIVLAILAKKTFCSWGCPIGFLQELQNKVTRRFFPNRKPLNPKLNSWLKPLRYITLVVALYFTYRTGELILRGYDPFYIIFSGFGHGTLGWVSVTILGLLFIGAFIIPMFFCRYFCPLGATLDPFSRIGLIKIVRNTETCLECGDCATACPHDIKPFTVTRVNHRDCTNCLECIQACPVDDCLVLKLSPQVKS